MIFIEVFQLEAVVNDVAVSEQSSNAQRARRDVAGYIMRQRWDDAELAVFDDKRAQVVGRQLGYKLAEVPVVVDGAIKVDVVCFITSSNGFKH